MTLQMRNDFSASTHESINESFDFYNYLYYKRQSPIVILNLRFKINNYKNTENEIGDRNGKMEEDNSEQQKSGGKIHRQGSKEMK